MDPKKKMALERDPMFGGTVYGDFLEQSGLRKVADSVDEKSKSIMAPRREARPMLTSSPEEDRLVMERLKAAREKLVQQEQMNRPVMQAPSEFATDISNEDYLALTQGLDKDKSEMKRRLLDKMRRGM
jgi:uncharacterized membrane protein